MSNVDRFKSKRSVELSKKYQKSFIDGGKKKICNTCKKPRELDQYNKRQGGLQSNCKPCMYKYNKKRRDRAKQHLW